jgi:tetratricopeptide (TPR) repeat protein
MDVSLAAALVGTAAAVVAVPIAVLQLHQGNRHTRRLESSGRPGEMREVPGACGVEAVRTILPPPLGRLPVQVRGRSDVVEELAGLWRNPGGRAHVLAGLGGAGKSTIALAVTRQAAAAGLRVWWVAGADPATVMSALLSLARRLGAPTGELDEALAGRIHPADVLWPRLEATPGWVLVFDNVDDTKALGAAGRRAEDATGWLRPTRAGLVLVTSRIGDPQIWGPMACIHRVGSLDDADGAQVLLDLAPDAGDASQAAQLSSRLGGLPLALHQAGTYLGSPFAAHRTFEAYGEALEARFGQLLGRADEDRARVTGTWELSLTGLTAQGRGQARPLLRLLSCFAPATPIPAGLLEPEVLGRRYGGLAGVEDGLSGLLATGLIEVRASAGGGPPSVLVHPLVAETTRQRAGSSLGTSFAQAAELLNAAAGHLADDDSADRDGWLSMLPHLEFVLSLKVRSDSKVHAGIADTAARASRALSWTGSYLAGLEIADAGLAQVTTLDQHSSTVLALRFQRAIATLYLGHYADAETELRQVLAGRLSTLGPDHPDTLTARHYIAAALAHQGKPAEAEVLFREVLARRLDILGLEHPHTLSTRHWIAAVVARQGTPDQAEAESRNVLDARLRTLGAEHPSTLATSHDVAKYLADQGRLEEAEAMFRQVLAARTQVLAVDHPRTLETQYELAVSLARQGKVRQAQSILEHVFGRQSEILGPSHPDTLRTAEWINRLQL